MRRIKAISIYILLVIFTLSFTKIPRVANAATTLPGPTPVRAFPTSISSINVNWGAVTGASGYAVYRATSSTGAYSLVLSTTARSINNTGLTTGRTYYYKVRAYRIVGSSRVYGNYSTVVSATPAIPVPTSVNAFSSSSSSINVNWGAVTGASGYAVYRATSDIGEYSLLSYTTATNYNNTGLTTGTPYYYKVRVYKIVGSSKVYSDYSTVVSAAPTISVPTPVRAFPTSINSINVNWGAVTGASGYAVYRATSSTGAYSLILSTTARSINNTGLTTGTTYYYKVRAYRIVGSSRLYDDYSDVVSAKPVLPAPTPVRAFSTSINSINVNWGAATGASGYAVYRATSSTGAYSLILSTTARSINNTGLTTGTTYYYKIRTYRIVGSSKVYSDYSTMVSVRPAPPVPTSVKAVTTSYNSINISWGSSTGANGYELYRAASSTQPDTLIATTTATSYSNTGLATGTTYYYKVRAYRIVNGAKAYSDFSVAASGTTPVVNVASVSLNKGTSDLTVGSIDILKAAITPTYATNQSVTWTTSDDTVVKVDNTGNITAVSEGTAVITVTTLDGSKTARCTVTVTASEPEIKGIDVSKFQGTIDWAAVKSDGVRFAMLRSSFGDGTSNYSNRGVDPMFETNYEGAKANGIAVGAYHYSYAETVAEAAAEADFFISQLQGKQFEYPVCVDIEDPSQSSIDKQTLTNIAITYLEKLKAAGYYPLIYANKYWFTTVLDDTRLISYDHWLAQYNTQITYTGKVGIWQYTSSGTVKGISGNVDMDISYIDYASKIKLLHLNGF